MTVSLMCVVFPCSPFQRRERVRAAPVKWPVQLLLRENFPSGPLPNASDHCFCPRLPAWGWSAGVPSSSETPQQEGAEGSQGGLPPASPPAPRAPQDGHMASAFLQALSSSFPLICVVFNPPVSTSWPPRGSEQAGSSHAARPGRSEVVSWLPGRISCHQRGEAGLVFHPFITALKEPSLTVKNPGIHKMFSLLSAASCFYVSEETTGQRSDPWAVVRGLRTELF